MPPNTLSADLVEVYSTYKKGTKEIVAWLLCAGTKGKLNYDRTDSLPVLTSSDLRYLADRVIENGTIVPDTILRAFQLTIEARETMSCYYQKLTEGKDLTADDSHAFFNVLLKDIYRDFKSEKKIPNRKRRDSGTASHVDSSNRFDCLLHHTKEPDNQMTDFDHSDTTFATETSLASTFAQKLNISDSGNSSNLGNDKLEEFMDICTYIIQIDQLSKVVTELYASAAAGEQALTVAALMTNIAYHCSEELSKDLQRHGIFDPTQLRQRHRLLVDGIQPDHPKFKTLEHVERELSSVPTIAALERTWQVLSRFKKQAKAEMEESNYMATACQGCKLSFQDPIQCFGLQALSADESLTADAVCLEAMLWSLHNHIKRVHKSLPEARFRRLLYRDIDRFVRAADTDLSLSCQLSFGLHMLLESYKAYLSKCVEGSTTEIVKEGTGNRLKAANPRIRDLRFASDAKMHLEKMMREPCAPCGCLRVNGEQVALELKTLHLALQDHLRTPQFDLLAQSPWISGQHMLDYLMDSLNYGLQGWHHGYFVGSILHSYNALVHAGVLPRDKIPVLESMCTHFEDTVFMNARSSPNAYSCYKRWTGGRVKFSTHHKSGSTEHTLATASAKKWHMCQVPDASHGGDNEKRSFTASRMSLFSLLAEGTHFLDPKVISWVESSQKHAGTRKPSSSSKRQKRPTATTPNPVPHICRIRDVLTAELHPKSPPSTSSIASPARINTFLVYRLCLLALNKMSDATHLGEKGIMCRCTTERCLRACEEYHHEVRTARKGKVVLLGDRAVCESVRDALVEVFGGLKEGEIEWGVL